MIIERGHEASIVDMFMYPVHVMVSHLLSHLMIIFELKLDRIEKSGDQEERFWIFKGSIVIISGRQFFYCHSVILLPLGNSTATAVETDFDFYCQCVSCNISLRLVTNDSITVRCLLISY